MANLDFTLPRDRNTVAVHDPLSKYKISEQDESGDLKYYGFLAHDGSFYIQKWNTVDGTFRYYANKGHDLYLTKWASRVSNEYDYFDLIF